MAVCSVFAVSSCFAFNGSFAHSFYSNKVLIQSEDGTVVTLALRPAVMQRRWTGGVVDAIDSWSPGALALSGIAPFLTIFEQHVEGGNTSVSFPLPFSSLASSIHLLSLSIITILISHSSTPNRLSPLQI